MSSNTFINNDSLGIVNTGHIAGDCITDYNILIINMNNNRELDDKFNRILDSLDLMSKALTDSVKKQKEIELMDAETRLVLARAAENNSQANIRNSQSIERIINLFESAVETQK